MKICFFLFRLIKERLLLENRELNREIEVKWSPIQEQYDFYFQISNQQKLEIENLNKKLLEVKEIHR